MWYIIARIYKNHLIKKLSDDIALFFPSLSLEKIKKKAILGFNKKADCITKLLVVYIS